MGIDNEKIIFEKKSKNTFENIIFSKQIGKPKKYENWLLITSASHMKRALLVGETHDWYFTPYAVDFLNAKDFEFRPNFKLSSNLNSFQKASHEWLGLIVYYLLGRTDKVF